MAKNNKNERAAGASGNLLQSSAHDAGQPATPAKTAPIVEAYAVFEKPGEGFVPLRYFVQGDKVLKIDTLGEPNMRAIAIGTVERRMRAPRED